MRRVLFLISGLDYSGAAKQLSLLAPGLGRTGWAPEVYSLGGDGPFDPVLRATGVPVLTSTARPVLRWLGLRRLLPASDGGGVHALGPAALRRLWSGTPGRPGPKVVVGLTGRDPFPRLDRRALRLTSRALVPHAAAADALIARGLPAARITVVPP